MSFQPIHQTDLPHQVYERLRQMILSGVFKPGEKLPQERIAAQLGVSRMPLHKAFVMLEEEYLVESIPRRGIFVRKPDIRAIIDAFECREGLEGVAARRATENLSNTEIDRMDRLFDEFRGRDDVDLTAYQGADQRFHEMIIRASGNRVMQKLNNIGSILISTYPRGIILSVGESLDDHGKITAAFRARDAALAERLIRDHSRKAVERLSALPVTEE